MFAASKEKTITMELKYVQCCQNTCPKCKNIPCNYTLCNKVVLQKLAASEKKGFFARIIIRSKLFLNLLHVFFTANNPQTAHKQKIKTKNKFVADELFQKRANDLQTCHK